MLVKNTMRHKEGRRYRIRDSNREQRVGAFEQDSMDDVDQDPQMRILGSMRTLQGLYYEKIVGSSSSSFADIVTIGERIENGLKIGKIASVDSQTVVKKSHGFVKKKEVEASVVMANVYPRVQAHMAHVPYYPYPYIASTQYQQPAY
ncbi:hypothetical protein KIW84_044205 [Lathyrus oleraceus]|uniref:Uncharacterized protein n=1 Tax=Pisum sativum TaxID=3888 RepID=A0A9D4XFP4_PEA|nr:hypothetical protein KIW84_044205 [Pisum sativum]